jgi:BirA family biotin operon repressor/biotin-[acetyl-CoA-carboxylase] ligase
LAEGAARVLELLRAPGEGACSGEALSNELEVSRAQVWKHVESLRKRGYQIEGEPGGGYRLAGTPDRLYPEEILHGLGNRWLGREIHYRETTDSTNRDAFELARKGAPHGAVVIAESQTAGRGRLGRSFYSPAFLNLYASFILRPTLNTAEAPTLIPCAAVAVAEAVAACVPSAGPVQIKWPNDVQLGGLKTSGILMEMSAEATQVDFAIMGIGVNLNVERESFPDDFRPFATSLRSAAGHEVDRGAFTRGLFEVLEEVLDRHAAEGFAGLRERYEARFALTGKPVRVLEIDGGETTGVARGISADGALELERPDGRVVRVIAGDVTLAKEHPNAG